MFGVKIKHKGLREFAATGSIRGIPAGMAGKLSRILLALATAETPSELNNPAWRLHPMKGDMAGYWSIRVTGNWRLIFRFEHGEVVKIDLIDYH